MSTLGTTSIKEVTVIKQHARDLKIRGDLDKARQGWEGHSKTLVTDAGCSKHVPLSYFAARVYKYSLECLLFLLDLVH
jgi:hypothetical protein